MIGYESFLRPYFTIAWTEKFMHEFISHKLQVWMDPKNPFILHDCESDTFFDVCHQSA